jgi:hypothetical protein
MSIDMIDILVLPPARSSFRCRFPHVGHSFMSWVSAIVCLCFFFVLPRASFAQVDTGTLSGVVRDQSGAVVQNASIKIQNPATGVSQNLSTNSQGLYSAPDLKAGVYQVSVSAQGFETITKTGIALRVQDRVALDFELKVGQSSISVSVESQVSALQTETSSLGQVVDDAQIRTFHSTGATISNSPLWARARHRLTTLPNATASQPMAFARFKTAICLTASTTRTRLWALTVPPLNQLSR